MTIGDGIALCGLWALIGWYLWLVHRTSILNSSSKRATRRTGDKP